MVELGASYTDVVSAITQAQQRGSLKARVAFDALPRQGRQYYLEEAENSDAESGTTTRWIRWTTPTASEDPTGVPSRCDPVIECSRISEPFRLSSPLRETDIWPLEEVRSTGLPGLLTNPPVRGTRGRADTRS